MNLYSLPKIHERLLFLLFATSSVVFFEPAPFDILFIGTFAFFAATGALRVRKGTGFMISALLLFSVLSLVSIPLSVIDVTAGIRFYAITLYLVLLSIFLGMVISTYGEQALQPVVKGMILSFVLSLFVAYLSVAGVLPFKDIVMFFGVRFRGFFKDGNVLGPTLIGILLCVINQMRTRESMIPRAKAYYALAFVMCFMGAIMTYSRSTWGTLAVSIVIYYALSSGRKAIKNLALVIPVALALAATAYLIAQSLGYDNILRNRMSLQYYDVGRFYIYGLLLDKAAEHPLGIGPGQTDLFIHAYHDNVINMGSDSAQNTMLRLLMEHGIPVVLIFIVFTLACLWHSFRLSLRKWPHAGLSAVCFTSLLGYTVCSIVIDTLHWRILWIFSGLIIGLHALHKNHLSTLPAGQVIEKNNNLIPEIGK